MIKSKYQQPGFKFQTNYADYDVEYHNWVIGEEKWIVHVNYKDMSNGVFECPIDWSREYIFGWLTRMEIDNI